MQLKRKHFISISSNRDRSTSKSRLSKSTHPDMGPPVYVDILCFERNILQYMLFYKIVFFNIHLKNIDSTNC